MIAFRRAGYPGNFLPVRMRPHSGFPFRRDPFTCSS
jgi:hypothetical protein